MKTIAIFDFLSHEEMHLPFNEGYVKIACAAFPDHRITFAAKPKHIAKLKGQCDFGDRVEFHALNMPISDSPGAMHNPIHGSRVATAYWRQVQETLAANENTRLVSFLGADASMIRIFTKNGRRDFDGAMHYILHNHLSAALIWRSRNPLIRYFDYISTLKKGFPARQKLVALELGIAESVIEMFPATENSLLTLEHPILETEWAEPKPLAPGGPLKIGFIGHCGTGKGFDYFVHLADKFASPAMEFHAIGLRNPNIGDIDLSSLRREPSPSHVPRAEYISCLADMDALCFPMGDGYNYVASGSIIDGITSLKPLILIRNRAFTAMENKYGPVGPLVADRPALDDYFAACTAEVFAASRDDWIANLRKIRGQRHPDRLGQEYRTLIDA